MRAINGHTLWVGHAGNLGDPRALLATRIVAVVELADCEPMAMLPRDLIRMRFPFADGGGNSPWLVRLALESVAALVRDGVPVAVCCSAGMSRSVAVAAGGLALAKSMSPATALRIIAETGPADVSPGLWMEIVTHLGFETR